MRRTEYITATGGGGHSGLRDPGRRSAPKKKRQTDAEKNEPINILRSILKGFDIAHPEDAYKGQDTVQNLRAEEITPEERRAWDNPKHPANPSLKLLDSYPVLPDLDAITETGGYIVAKFQTNPIAQQGAHYDERVNVSILRVLEPTEEQEQAYHAKLAEHDAEADPTKPPPQRDYDYEFFLPASQHATRGIKRKFSTIDQDAHADAALYDHENPESGKRCFRYDRVRFYETYQQAGNPLEPYEDTVAVALHDPELEAGGAGSRLPKGAYYYPIVQRTFIRPKRKAPRGGAMGEEEQENRVDVLEIEVRDLDEREAAVKSEFREKLETEVEGEA